MKVIPETTSWADNKVVQSNVDPAKKRETILFDALLRLKLVVVIVYCLLC
jgi:hypothetical protein